MPKNTLLSTEGVVVKWNLQTNATPNQKQDPISALQRDPELASLIYKINDPEAKANIHEKLYGYEIFSITTTLPSTSKIRNGKFQALAAINQATQEVVFVTAGTRLSSGVDDFLADAKDDLHLGLGLYPVKLKAAQKLNNAILKELGNKASSYHFHYTGHSLGAAMADAAATDMGIKLHKKRLLTKDKISTVTFDNPGAYTLVKNQLEAFAQKKKAQEINRHTAAIKKLNSNTEKVAQENKRHKDALNKLEKTKLTLNNEWKEKVQYKAFNNRANIINTADKQAGDKFIIVPNAQKERSSFSQLIGWVAKKFPGPIVKKILYLISYGTIQTQVKEHSIDNFIDVLKKEKGELLYTKEGVKHPISLVDAAYNIQPVEYNEELFAKLKRKIEKRKPGSKDHKRPNHSMTFNNPQTGLTTRIEFTKDELSRAYRTPTKPTPAHPTNPVTDKKTVRILKNLMQELKGHFNTTNSSAKAPSKKSRTSSRRATSK